MPRLPFRFGIIRPMLKIDIISVQPKMFEGFLKESIVARAVKKGACEINIVDLREFGEGRWRKVDDSARSAAFAGWNDAIKRTLLK